MKRTGYVASIFLLVALAPLAGCSGSGGEVSGTVRIDGQPLKEGDILFEEEDKSKTPSAVKIVDGTYTIKVLPGSKLVRINASRPTGKVDPHMKSVGRESLIAPEFNERTTLKAEITPGKQEGVDFDVKSIP